MSGERQPPRLGHEAPGLVWRARKNGWAATWQARSDLIGKGYLPKTVALWTGAEPTEAEAKHISTRCLHLQSEMLVFARGEAPAPLAVFNGTLRSLINCYQTDKDSPYHKNRYNVRQNKDRLLRRLADDHGDVPISDIKARLLIAWHQGWTDDGRMLAMGAAFMAQLRSLFSFGATLLEDKECERLCSVTSKMRFPGVRARTESLSAPQADTIRRKAAELGWASIALGQAFQFECTLRQKDVIGEWLPLSEPGVSDVISGGSKWLAGIRWEEIDENLILRHNTSKRQKETEVDLKLAPMVLDELRALVGEPLIVGGEVRRHLLPASGPIVVNGNTGWPWTASEYRRKWRKIAKACGIPANVWNMDSRAGAISEAVGSGAPLGLVRHAATHSDIAMTQKYDREQAKATATVMKMRIETRNKPSTGDD